MNSVCIIGNLTRDPELRSTPSGTSVCSLGVAVNEREKKGDEWVEVGHFFDVTVWGNQGESCAQYLAKGKKVGITGRLNYRSWEADDGSKRSKVDIVAHRVEFLTPKGDGDYQGEYTGVSGSQTAGPATSADDDIPF